MESNLRLEPEILLKRIEELQKENNKLKMENEFLKSKLAKNSAFKFDDFCEKIIIPPMPEVNKPKNN